VERSSSAGSTFGSASATYDMDQPGGTNVVQLFKFQRNTSLGFF
jgi:hypothetical protein